MEVDGQLGVGGGVHVGCPLAATLVLTWPDGEEQAFCNADAETLIEESAVRQSLHAVVASAPVDDRSRLTIRRPALWRLALRRQPPAT